MPTTTIRLELTEAQQEHAPTAWVPGAATGREVNGLELRLQELPEPAEGQEEAPGLNNPARQENERLRPGHMARLRSARDGKERKER